MILCRMIIIRLLLFSLVLLSGCQSLKDAWAEYNEYPAADLAEARREYDEVKEDIRRQDEEVHRRWGNHDKCHHHCNGR